jgi:hypothetical protein
VTAWIHSVSWSKFKLALDCPRQLQHTIDRKPHGRGPSGFYQEAGSLTQLVFELYFNQQVNLKPGGRTEATQKRVIERVLNAPSTLQRPVSLPHNLTREDLNNRVRDQATRGFELMGKIKMLDLPVRCEVKWNAVFRGFRIFNMLDFLREGRSGHWILDGKGHTNPDADERQILYQALGVAASGHNIAGAGLLYWYHGFKPVDTSPKALKEVADTTLEEARPTFELLKKGTHQPLEARPSPKRCGQCNWRETCEASVAKRPPTQSNLPDIVQLDHQPTAV